MTIINNYQGKEADLSPEQFVLKSVSEHRYIINEFEPANVGERSKLQQMISYGLRSHVDNQFHVFDGTVQILESATDFKGSTNAVVQNAIWIHDMPFYNEFMGFSDEVIAQVKAIQSLDGAYTLTGSQEQAEGQSGSVGLYTFQKKIYALKVSMEAEVNTFLDEYLPTGSSPKAQDSGSPFLANQNFQLNTFDANQQELSDLDPVMVFSESKKKRGKKNKQVANDNALFTERIVSLLEENNKILANYNSRFEDIQSQIDAMKHQPAQPQESTVSTEIAELRQMILDLSEGREIKELDGSTTSVASPSITVVFEKNAYELSLGHQARLNKAVSELISHPSYTALITGYADKTGNSEFNAWISKARADSVRDYFVANGIPEQRLVLNFLGDEESEYSNPADRKVEVQFLQNTSSLLDK